ncbi:MAG: diacylglyceryl transferase [Rhizobiales bacterium]|nr:diacylglyceryl transferase [Hyphomicrobiales bacterium]
MVIHTLFDLAAAACSLLLTVWVYHWRLRDDGPLAIEEFGTGYAVALIGGAVVGGFGFGTLNLWLSGVPGLGRSIVGALAGAILAIEIFKRTKNITGSTGLIFVPGFAASVAVGRWGCFFSGLDDQTYGTPATLPWARDFGDSILRHPVQAYEALSMAVFVLIALVCFARRQPVFMRHGFYLMVGYYGAQRFVWEFFKPYATVAGPLNVFHFLCLALIAYAGLMIKRTADDRTAA